MFFRKVIYIGESDGQAIYVNVEKPRDPLAAPKSKLLNTEASRGNRKQIILITSFLIIWWCLWLWYFDLFSNCLASGR